MTFTSTLVRGRDPRGLAREAGEALGPASADALGFVYASDRLASDMDALIEGLVQETGVAHWIGGVGIGVCSEAEVVFDEPAASVMVGDVPRSARHFFAGSRALGDGRGQVPPDWVTEHEPCLSVLHADPGSPAFEGALSELGERGFVVGGLLSSRGRVAHAVDGGVVETGISGVVFGAEVALATGLTQGCRPMAGRHTVTRCEGQLLLELDHRPAVEVLRDAIKTAGEGIAPGALHVAIVLPGDDGRDYLVRNLLGLDMDSGAVAVGEHLEPGQRVMFCRRDAVSAGSDMQDMLAGLAGRIDGTPRGGLYVSCLARGPNLFDPPDAEIAAIRQTFPDLPLLGFFANGEFSRDRLYAYTGVLTLFL